MDVRVYGRQVVVECESERAAREVGARLRRWPMVVQAPTWEEMVRCDGPVFTGCGPVSLTEAVAGVPYMEGTTRLRADVGEMSWVSYDDGATWTLDIGDEHIGTVTTGEEE